MLRNILITLGVLIALLQFPGFPYDIARWLSTLLGLAIVVLLTIQKWGLIERTPPPPDEEISVERKVTVTRMGREKPGIGNSSGGDV